MLQAIGWNPGAEVVPEPSQWVLMLLGVGMLGGGLRRRPAAQHQL
jgi:hypothetical protein